MDAVTLKVQIESRFMKCKNIVKVVSSWLLE